MEAGVGGALSHVRVKEWNKILDYWEVSTVSRPLERGQAPWLLWPVEYGKTDALPVSGSRP